MCLKIFVKRADEKEGKSSFLKKRQKNSPDSGAKAFY
jgi:hypothetical protein